MWLLKAKQIKNRSVTQTNAFKVCLTLLFASALTWAVSCKNPEIEGVSKRPGADPQPTQGNGILNTERPAADTNTQQNPVPTDSPQPAADNPQTNTQTQPNASSNTQGSDLFRFNLPEPTQAQRLKTISIWGTFYYFAHFVVGTSGNYPVRDTQERVISPGLQKKEWCDAALQGSFSIKDQSGKLTTYSFSGRSSQSTVDCSDSVSDHIADKIKGNRFEVVNVPYGRGARVPQVVPYRTLAVDPRVIPHGTVLYIPQARGQKVTLPDGKEVTHDGYFYAGDAGSAIIGNHVDFFCGPVKRQPFTFVQSSAQHTFPIVFIESAVVLEEMKRVHRLN